MYPRDVWGQATLEALGRPWRTLLTVLGTVLGVGMFVATLGITDSGRARVNQRFDALLSTEVDVQDAHPDDGVFALTSAGEAGAARLNGVRAAGLLGKVEGSPEMSALPLPTNDLASSPVDRPELYYADLGALRVIRPRLERGRLFDRTQLRRAARVALLGANAARSLGIEARELPTVIYIAGSRFVVEGVIRSLQRHDELLSAVVVPESTAIAMFGRDSLNQVDMIVATRFGYANSVGAVLAAAVSPVDPDRVTVLTPPDPTSLRTQVAGDISGLLGILAGVGLLVGMIGIGNTTLVSVLERVREIGLRRALGARRSQIATQFLLESLTLGTVGGVLGVCLGLIGVTTVALAKGWAPVLPLWVLVCAPLIGTLAGLLAGSYPAMRAARIDPVTALAQ
jgi:ABC-type antimicrobial peptide transport system permease subunit